MATIQLDHVSYAYGKTPVLHNVSLTIAEGELHTLLGPSGCGKTTTLCLIAGFLVPTAGHILINGKDVAGTPPEKRAMGVVFQNYALFPQMTVEQNVAYGLKMKGLRRPERTRRAGEALELVGLADLASRNVAELSGGQQQRVAIARALAPSPSVLLLDEPMANLDEELRAALRTEIRRIQQSVGVTTLFITHDQQEALSLSDTVTVMDSGTLAQTGAPRDIYEHPATPFVADFTGQMNRIPAADGTGEPLCARPEQLRLTSEPTTATLCAVTVTAARYRGFATEYAVAAQGSTVPYGGEPAGRGRPGAPDTPITVLALSNPAYARFAVGDTAFLELVP